MRTRKLGNWKENNQELSRSLPRTNSEVIHYKYPCHLNCTVLSSPNVRVFRLNCE